MSDKQQTTVILKNEDLSFATTKCVIFVQESNEEGLA